MISVSELWRRQEKRFKTRKLRKQTTNVPDNTNILKLMPPPELHTFMGGTNNPVDLLIKKYGRERVESWGIFT